MVHFSPNWQTKRRKKMRKRLLATISLLVLAGLILAACAPAAPVDTGAEDRIADLEAQLEEAQAGAVSDEELAALQEELDAARAEAEAAMAEAPTEEEVTYERSETLYTSGTQWGPPSSWNPFNTGGYAMGTIGLVYETLFRYDPLTNEFTPWLAESGEWTSDTTYELVVRDGVTWSDGEPFTAADVKFTWELGQEAPINIQTVWSFLDSIEEVDDNTLQFNFSTPAYQQWANYLYGTPMVPEHIWGDLSVEDITSGINENPIGTGPYVYDTHDQSRMVWVKRDGWWATDVYGMDPAPTRIVDIVNGSNNVALGLVLQGGLDLSNNFLPGVATLVDGGYGIETYYPEPPYMLSANTVWLLMNTTMAPMDDPAFRQAMAYVTDVDQITELVYGNMAAKADPTGLLPPWEQYVDQDVVDELGFSFDIDQARTILANAGYVDVDGDGFVEMPDGSPIELKIIVPFGWTDWMESIRIVANGAQAAGINLEPDFPEFPAYLDAKLNGTFEMMLNNDEQLSNTPWTYYDWIFQNPIEDVATVQDGNYGRYDNQEAFDLVDQLDQIPVEDVEGMSEVISQLQTIYFTDMPLIPLWYNPMFAQYNNSVWTNWPSSEEGGNHYLPCTWRGYWNMTSIDMLTALEPVPPAEE
jgi:peptide/nickel transport system substrate-binding protein